MSLRKIWVVLNGLFEVSLGFVILLALAAYLSEFVRSIRIVGMRAQLFLKFLFRRDKIFLRLT